MVIHKRVGSTAVLSRTHWLLASPAACSKPELEAILTAALVCTQMMLMNESPAFLLLNPAVQVARHKELPVFLFETGMLLMPAAMYMNVKGGLQTVYQS